MASGSKRVIVAALIGNSLIAVTKFAAAAFTGSSAIPFGHGKEVYFWSFIVAILIFAVGAGVSIHEGVQHLLHPEPLRNVTVNYAVLGLALVFEGGAWYFAFVEFNRARGSWGYVEAVQSRSDCQAARYRGLPYSAVRTRRCSWSCSRIRRPCSVC